MHAVILAAGYATRLRPLTDSVAKPLLPVGGRPMVDWIMDAVDTVDDVTGVHVVTNSRYAPDFERWARERRGVRVHDDGTRSNDDRLGAVGDIHFVVDAGGLDGEDLLVIAGDNLFEFSLRDYVGFWRGKGESSAIAVHRLADPSLASLYGVVELDEEDRVVRLEEKPEHPRSDLISAAMYVFHRAHVPLIGEYLDEGNSPDHSGAFLAWLYRREPVFGYRFEDAWLDIGDRDQLLEADNRLRARLGLPRRDEYSLDPA
jgi:glucose-1-phosphate thymidylyltransferase